MVTRYQALSFLKDLEEEDAQETFNLIVGEALKFPWCDFDNLLADDEKALEWTKDEITAMKRGVDSTRKLQGFLIGVASRLGEYADDVEKELKRFKKE